MEHEFISHLKQDHEKQRVLGTKLVNSASNEEREKLRKEFHDELLPHMVGEESSIFKFMQSANEDKIREAAREAVQEHHVGKLVLRELMDLSLDSEIFKAKAKVLLELNNHHLEEEEKKHFPVLQKLAPKQELEKLFKVYEDAEEKAKGE